jgi:hypothetical protein
MVRANAVVAYEAGDDERGIGAKNPHVRQRRARQTFGDPS